MLAHFARFRFPIAAFSLFLIGFLITLPVDAVSFSFSKITYNTTPSSDLPNTLVTGNILSATPTSRPCVDDSVGLGDNPNPASGQTFATTRRYTVHNLGSSGEDGGLRLDVFDGPGNTDPFPTHSFFDLFNHFSVPDSNGEPTAVATTMRRLEVHNLGSSGQDGVEINFRVIDPNTGDEVPITITCTIPAGQGLSFDSPPIVALTPLTTDPALDGTPSDPQFSSFFDIFTELSITGPLDPDLPMFSLTTTLNTPEPASLLLLGIASTTLLTRRRRPV